ncbi:hypothetical protein [Ruminococcus difficilis]|uniref:Uncharacterized protein n=1 Tax=Ruminococcus difficilis TaxID=2763069 RepID=A0A934WPP7_9FIRM|nr:hypothetical protein [Ruminococcus difficilis]MBK6088551.1 hypothetical protein [Ruminococcus difficilis]
MAIRTEEEEKRLSEKRSNRKKAFAKFREDFMASFLLGIKAGGILTGALIVLYLAAKFIFRWDLFYETDLNYAAIFLVLTIVFAFLVLICIMIAVILYNNKHKRNTKYTQR